MNRLLRTSAWCVCLGAIALSAIVPAGAATKTTKKSAKKTTKRVVTTKKRSATATAPTAAPTTTAPATTVAAATLAPTTVATTAVPTTVATTVAPTTAAPTTAAPAYDYILRVTQPTQKAAPGTTVSFIVVAEAKAGTLGPVTLLPVGIPPGVSATLDQNPISSAGEMKFILPSTLPIGFYEVRINGVSNGIGRSVTATIVVEGAAVATTTTTTIAGTTTTIRPTFKYSVVVAYPAGTLSTGGTLSYPITVNRDPSNNDTITLSASNLPTNVWAGFSDNPIGKDSTMWISSSLPLTKGVYPFNLVITSLGTSQAIPIQLTIV
jgi:hypothetical protein